MNSEVSCSYVIPAAGIRSTEFTVMCAIQTLLTSSFEWKVWYKKKHGVFTKSHKGISIVFQRFFEYFFRWNWYLVRRKRFGRCSRIVWCKNFVDFSQLWLQKSSDKQTSALQTVENSDSCHQFCTIFLVWIYSVFLYSEEAFSSIEQCGAIGIVEISNRRQLQSSLPMPLVQHLSIAIL